MHNDYAVDYQHAETNSPGRVASFTCYKYSAKQLLDLRPINIGISDSILSRIETLGISVSNPSTKRKRGHRGRRHIKKHQNLIAQDDICDETITEQSKIQTPTQLPAVFMTNAQSLGNKMDEVDVILRQENIDIAVVTESWFSPKNISKKNSQLDVDLV